MRKQMENTAPAFRTNRLLQGLVLWLVLLWIVTSIEPFNRRDWFLENLLVFFYGTLLVVTYRRFAFSNRSYVLFTIFMSLHLVGAHYTYSEVPFGFWLQETLGLERMRPASSTAGPGCWLSLSYWPSAASTRPWKALSP
jgi:putative membrane protein